MIELFHFLRPDWLWALIPLAIVLLLWYRREGKSRSWQNYCDPELLPFLMVGSEVGRSHLLMVTGGLAGLLTIIALAGPTWEQRPQPLFRAQSAMVIALDLSLSMNATDVRPNRLDRAKLKLRDILERRKEGQTGLLVFAAEPFVVSPLTTDTAT
ncbi:MAG: VWA domain-containing protein, partial [Gammaproteobacteria bacterium]|nr:VWA domain-containing protein [Gammaproteobacteria bacterium]